MDTYTVSEYTGQYDDQITPRVVPAPGDRMRVPEDPNCTGTTADAREADAFRRRCTDASVQVGEYIETIDGWDHYAIECNTWDAEVAAAAAEQAADCD